MRRNDQQSQWDGKSMISANRLATTPRLTEARPGTLDTLAVCDCEGVRVYGDGKRRIRCNGRDGRWQETPLQEATDARYRSGGSAGPRNHLRQRFG